MKSKIKSFILIFSITALLLGLLGITNISNAATSNITLENLDFQIQLNEDGSMKVTENWDAKIKNTNTMFKDFTIDSTKFGQIQDVEVYEVSKDGQKTKLTKINEEMYHVTKGCYYGMIVESGDFEIAWGVSINGTTNKKYQIQYTVTNVVKTYLDCSEFYWQLVGNKNTIPVNNLTATIELPKAVTNKDNLRAWAHGPYNGNVALDTKKVNLEVSYLNPKVYVEARIAVKEALFPKNKVINSKRFDTILAEEEVWANQANKERQQYIKNKEQEQKNEKAYKVAATILSVILGLFFLYKLYKNFKKYQEIKRNIKPIMQIDYFRDIPDETASAGDAAFLYYLKNGSFTNNISKVLSATMLQLCLKKYISFSEDNTEKKPQVRVNILDYTGHIDTMPPLKKDEQVIYELLKKVGEEKNNTFTMKEFEKYAKTNSSSFISKINEIEKLVKQEQIKLKNYDSVLEKESTKSTGVSIGYFVSGVIFLAILPIVGVILIMNGILSSMIASKLTPLTVKGREEQEKWQGLKKYMKDFSLLDDKEVPDLVLWEKYLVFATAFGIADEVLKQLKIKYPELQEVNGYHYMYMHLLYHSTLNMAFLTSFNTAVNNVYMGGMSAQASSSYSGTNFSSGGGFGGGFSGGGGFGGGGGRNGRQIKQKIQENKGNQRKN